MGFPDGVWAQQALGWTFGGMGVVVHEVGAGDRAVGDQDDGQPVRVVGVGTRQGHGSGDLTGVVGGLGTGRRRSDRSR